MMSSEPGPQQWEAELAQRYGAASDSDSARGAGWNRYWLGDWRIWYCGARGWACATLVSGYYRNHRYSKSLETCFRFATEVNDDLSNLDEITKKYHMEKANAVD